MLDLTWDQAISWRVGRHHLSDPVSDPVRLAGDLGGVQAQVASSTLQAMAVRSTAVPDIESLLWEERTLVKTWAMRGTLHLLPSVELDIWIGALRQRKWKITPGWEKYHGISAAQLEVITEAIPVVLSGDPMTREELAEAIVAKVGDPELLGPLSSGWSQLLKPAANQGLLAQGPPRGRNTTFVAPAEWVTSTSLPERDDAMGIVVERFLDAYGPATSEDFARWFGVDPKSARELMSPHLEEMVAVSVEGEVCWLTPGGAEAASKAEPVPGTLLLPGFDPYVLAPISHRRHTIPEGRADEVSRAAGHIAPAILDGGRIVGTWESAKDGTIRLKPFETLSRRQLSGIRDHIEHRYHGLLGDAKLELVDGS